MAPSVSRSRAAAAPALPAWAASIKRWQLLLAFAVAATTLGSLVLGTVGTLERTYGPIAAYFGWARERSVVESIDELRLWQLYKDTITAKQRLKTAQARQATPEELEALGEQLATFEGEYARLRAKRDGRRP